MIVQEKEFLTPEQVAELLQVDQETVLRWIRSGKLAGYRVGQKIVRVYHKDLDRFLAERRIITDEDKS